MGVYYKRIEVMNASRSKYSVHERGKNYAKDT